MSRSLADPSNAIPRGVFWPTLRRLFGFVSAYRATLRLSIALAIAAQGFALAVPWITGDIVDRAIRPRDTHLLVILIGLLLGAGVLRFALMLARRLVSGTMAVDVEYDLRNLVYTHLQRLSFSFYDRHQTGQLMSRATVDVSAVRVFLSYGLLFFTQYALTIATVLVFLVLTNPLLAIAGVAIAPVLVLVAWHYSRVSHPILTRAQQTLADLTTQAEENVVGVRVVKAFGQEARETARFRERAEAVFAANIRANRQRALYVPLMSFLPSLAVAAVLGAGGAMVVHGSLTLGSFVRFNLYLGMLVLPLRMVGMWVGQAQRAVASGLRVLEVLDLEPQIRDRDGAAPLSATGPGAIRFDHVSFAYDDGPAVLHDVDLAIEPGSSVAVIGPTGCGKTTLTALVPRFYDVTGGRVTIDGIDVRDLELASLRRGIGIVSEETFLFSASVRENIAFGAPGASDAEIHAAAERAQAAGFIATLPDGYDTLVGERGLMLSGGQRQRLAIARALLVDPRILILDDATASVDATTEARIKQALREVMRGRTTIIIGHRLSTIALADRVVVLDRGRVVGDGGHAQLLTSSEIYRRIHDHGLIDRTFVDLDGDCYVPPKEGTELEPAAPRRGSRLA